MFCLTKKKNDSKLIKDALKVLGKENLALIIHGSSFPAAQGEDTGFGSFNSSAGHALIDYASNIFNALQLGPAGKTKKSDSSPYCGTIFSGNPLFIDLKQLTTKEWNKILSIETYNKVVSENPKQNTGRTAYSYISEVQIEALKEAWNNFKGSKILKKEFEKFKKENAFWLENDSLYEALSIENNCDYWYIWNNEVDKNLMNPKSEEEKELYKKIILEIKEKYSDEIEFYSFCQFVLEIQNEATKKFALKNGIKMIAERQVAFSDTDAWAYQSLFLEGWHLGCPPDYFSKDGQAWGFPVMDPFDEFVDSNRKKIRNRPEIFGNQIVTDEEDKPIFEVESLLINATSISIEDVSEVVSKFNGICYPAHIDRDANGIIAVLGTLPSNTDFKKFEIHDGNKIDEYSERYGIAKENFIVSSDAHYLTDMRDKENYFEIDDETYSSQLVRHRLFEKLKR